MICLPILTVLLLSTMRVCRSAQISSAERSPGHERHAEFASPGAMANLALWSGRYVARTLFASAIVLAWPSLSSETSRSCKRSPEPLGAALLQHR